MKIPKTLMKCYEIAPGATPALIVLGTVLLLAAIVAAIGLLLAGNPHRDALYRLDGDHSVIVMVAWASPSPTVTPPPSMPQAHFRPPFIDQNRLASILDEAQRAGQKKAH